LWCKADNAKAAQSTVMLPIMASMPGVLAKKEAPADQMALLWPLSINLSPPSPIVSGDCDDTQYMLLEAMLISQTFITPTS
jgi:hypothetical protein